MIYNLYFQEDMLRRTTMKIFLLKSRLKHGLILHMTYCKRLFCNIIDIFSTRLAFQTARLLIAV